MGKFKVLFKDVCYVVEGFGFGLVIVWVYVVCSGGYIELVDGELNEYGGVGLLVWICVLLVIVVFFFEYVVM